MCKRIIVPFLVVLMLCNAGCLIGGSSSVRREGVYVADSTLREIEPGVTKQSWVLATLGPPTEKTMIEPGHELWQYSYKEKRNSSGYVFLLFGGSDSKVIDGRVFVEFEDGIVRKTWRG